jgi:hypothetical protein
MKAQHGSVGTLAVGLAAPLAKVRKTSGVRLDMVGKCQATTGPKRRTTP